MTELNVIRVIPVKVSRKGSSLLYEPPLAIENPCSVRVIPTTLDADERPTRAKFVVACHA
jgi:hypothetical protein